MDVKSFVIRVLVIAVAYTAAMYFLSGDTEPDWLKLVVQGLAFALFYALAVWLLYKFRKPKDKNGNKPE